MLQYSRVCTSGLTITFSCFRPTIQLVPVLWTQWTLHSWSGWWFQAYMVGLWWLVPLVGGELLVSISYMGCRPSHWRTPSFFRMVIAPPTITTSEFHPGLCSVRVRLVSDLRGCCISVVTILFQNPRTCADELHFFFIRCIFGWFFGQKWLYL